MIVPMKKLTLAALEADKEELLKALQAIGAVQLIPREEAAAGAALAALEGRVQRLDSAQALLKPYAAKAKMGPKPERTSAQLAEGIAPALELCAEVEAVERQLSAARGEREKKLALAEALLPWEGLEAGIEEIRSTESIRYLAGFIPPEELPRLEESGAVVSIFGGEKERAALIACHREDWEEVHAAVKATAFQEFSFPQLKGTPAANIAALKAEAEELEKKQQGLTEQLAAMSSERAAICQALDGASIERDREASKGALSSTATTFLLEGWVRSDQEQEVIKAVSSVTEAYYAEFNEPEEGDKIPTVLKNSKLVEPYEAVTNLYSLPSPHGVDGTPLMALFYFIFFGMMLSDTAYGLLLAIGAWAFIKIMKPTGMMGGIAKVLFHGGISTIIMGLLFGTIAGVSWNVIFAGTPIENTFPIIDSSAEPMLMLGLCAALGLIHMFYGVLVAAWRCIKQGDWMGAIIDNLCWLFIIVGLLLLAAPMLGLPQGLATVGKFLAIGSAVAVFLFAGRAKGWKPGRFMSGAGKLYDITSWLGDVLSYARIFALGLSTGVIGLVLNTLCWDMLFAAFKGNMILTVVGFVITAALSIALHLFMMAINTLGCFVHTARLQYVEFFGKFYEAGGKAFRPLGYKTRHVRVTE